MFQTSRHARPVRWIPRNRLGDASRVRIYTTLHQRQIRFLGCSIGKLRRERAMGDIRTRDQKYSAGSPIQPMNDARPLFASHLR